MCARTAGAAACAV
uniref:Uncharacterized protein n=1 Tax=Arundo donax TaxID=35708 RepID=A0A0A9C1Z6_ARUDO